MRKLLFGVLGLALMAAPAFAEDQNPPAAQATQGQLATQLVWRLNLGSDHLPAQEATRILGMNLVQPDGGWAADQPLTYGVLDDVMHHVYASYGSHKPEEIVPATALDKIVEAESDQTSNFWRWRHNYRLLTEN